MKTGFSLCSFSHRENPVFITWEPCNENGFFHVLKNYTGKTLFWPCTGPVRDCSVQCFLDKQDTIENWGLTKNFKSALLNLKHFSKYVNIISQKCFELIVCSLHTQHVEMNAKMLTKRFPFFSPGRKCLITDKFLNSNYHNFTIFVRYFPLRVI